MQTNHIFLEIDLNRAFIDFDGDTDSIYEVLQEFLEDTDRRLLQLEEPVHIDNPQYVGTVHELANSLGTAWCFRADQCVREIERDIRSRIDDFDRKIASHQIKTAVCKARKEVIELLKLKSIGADVFATLKN